ncbi:MAG: XRE family transcriptional regulator [Acidobacteria bacterium]|nr:MAG: XRE family transcriptional regulator [Acidobacteriota bacterium]
MLRRGAGPAGNAAGRPQGGCHVSLGKKLLRLRLEAGLTQQEVASAAGISVSYLSRLENDRAAPSLRTLARLSSALGLDVAHLFEAGPGEDRPERCPVSLSGRCILEQLVAGRGRRPEGNDEHYSTEQLELLRATNFLLHSDDHQVVSALKVLLRSLLRLASTEQAPESAGGR